MCSLMDGRFEKDSATRSPKLGSSVVDLGSNIYFYSTIFLQCNSVTYIFSFSSKKAFTLFCSFSMHPFLDFVQLLPPSSIQYIGIQDHKYLARFYYRKYVCTVWCPTECSGVIESVVITWKYPDLNFSSTIVPTQ